MARRKALSACLLVGVLVAGCSPTPEASPIESQADPLAAVAVTGAAYEEPTVQFQPPLDVVRPEKRVEIRSKIAPIKEDDLLALRYRIYDATTGDQLANTFPAPPIMMHMNDADLDTATYRALVGGRPGQRITAVAPSADGATHPALMVIDVLPLTAVGKSVPHKRGMPSVDTNKAGTPTVTATGDLPTELAKAIDIEGTGPPIEPGDTITVQSLAVRWDDKTVIESTWQDRIPITTSLDDVVEAWREALPGVKVGSRVVIVSPPELASGSGASVYVIDILARSAKGASAEGASPTVSPA